MSDMSSSRKSDADRTPDIFITDINIQRVRHLRDITIPLSKDERTHLILTGKNGSGKTSVLQDLKSCLMAQSVKPVAILLESTGDEEAGGVHIELNSLGQYRDYYSSGDFILAFYAARRQAAMKIPKGLEKITLKDRYDIEDEPGKEFIQHIVNLKVEKSFARDENDVETVENIEEWFNRFKQSLQEIFEDPSLRLEFDRKNYNFTIIQKGREPFDLNTMADGFSAVLNIVADLIMRMDKQKGKSYDVQGVVLIDELEAHLHIDLQKKVFPFLINFFPKIQFIVTTHSPFVLNSVENAVIYDLEHRLLVSDLSGYSYEGIIESYFDNDKYSQFVKDKIETYNKLAKQEKRSETEEEQMIDLRRYLKTIPDSLSPELKTRFQQIELERLRTKNG